MYREEYIPLHRNDELLYYRKPMEKLIKHLKEFDNNRTESINSGIIWNEVEVGKCFYPCAEVFLCNGYFLLNDEYVLDLGSIELYYHEEYDGGIKDHAMYHTNERLPQSYKDKLKKYSPEKLPYFYKVIYEHSGYPYFKIGSFNLHQSGVDITFENEEKGYRASFLIRAYRMQKKDDFNNENILYDPCSSHLYDDMYNAGLLSIGNNSTIVWVEYPKGGRVIQRPRRNLDDKPWQFMLEGLKEIK